MEEKKVIRVAIIGSGQIARTSHIPAYRSIENVEIVAVSDANKEAAKKLAEDFAIPAYYQDSIKMLQEIKPDVVSICVPNKFHYPLTIEALNAGCHVFCEKPPAMNPKEALEMWQLAKKRNLMLTYDFHFRHGTNTAIARKKIAAGELGDVYYTKASWVRRRGIPGWGCFTNREMQGGGPLIDIGAHMLDLACYLLDYPKVAYVCAGSFDRIGKTGNNGIMGAWNPDKYSVEDSLFGFIRFTDGRIMQLETAFALNIKEKDTRNVLLCGEKSGLSLFPLESYQGAEMSNIEYPFLEDMELHAKALHNFIHAVRGEEELLVTAEQGYYVQRLIDALYRSAESGEPVMLEE